MSVTSSRSATLLERKYFTISDSPNNRWGFYNPYLPHMQVTFILSSHASLYGTRQTHHRICAFPKTLPLAQSTLNPSACVFFYRADTNLSSEIEKLESSKDLENLWACGELPSRADTWYASAVNNACRDLVYYLGRAATLDACALMS